MPTLFMVGGPMGVGKTTTCQELKRLLPNCVFLDGDWCWDMDPFVVNEQTKALVLQNITTLLQNFLRCGQFMNVVFCWVLHEEQIWRQLLDRLDLLGWELCQVALVCSEEQLVYRLQSDVARGLRTADVIDRSRQRLASFAKLSVSLLDTTDRTARQAAEEIVQLADRGEIAERW